MGMDTHLQSDRELEALKVQEIFLNLCPSRLSHRVLPGLPLMPMYEAIWSRT